METAVLMKMGNHIWLFKDRTAYTIN